MKRNLVGKIFGIVLVFVMVGAMLGGFPGPINTMSADNSNGSSSITIRVKTETYGDGTIKTLDLESEYLPVVVACENGAAPYESMKAQAVASRTFALYKINYEPRSDDFDVYDDERDQVYNPGVTVTDQNRQSVRDTNGIVLRYTRVIICAFFVSGTGDTTEYVTYNEGKTGNDITQTTLGWCTDPPSKNPHNRGCMGQVQANGLASSKNYCYQQILRYFYGTDIEGLPINVPFKAQVPPGSWDETKNCGQASSLMVFSYYWNTEPTAEGIKKIDDWLHGKYGDPINNYNGWDTTTSKLEALARDYAKFPNSYKASGWTLDRLRREIDAGHPVIVAVTAGKIPYRESTDPEVVHYRNYKYEGGHFVVVKGHTLDCIICNDPGTSLGESKYYFNADFEAAMEDQGGAVVIILSPISQGLDWLHKHQSEDGSWYYTNPGGGKIRTIGLTALATAAFLSYGIEESDPAVSRGLNFILSNVDDEDGSITTGGWPVYDTSLAVLALLATDNQGEYGDEVTSAVGYLRDAQATDGGWTYEVGEGSDLSNTQFALLALYEADSKGWVSIPDNVFSNAATFVSSCQNPDGGFTYWPGGSPWVEPSDASYGSMTAAGIWSLKCCGVSDGINDARDWLTSHYHIDENYPIRNAWLYYYQYTLAKALTLAGINKLDEHDWYQDLSSWLVNQQRPDGSWLNPWPGEYHGLEREEMATSQAILALETKAPPLVPRSVRFTVDSPADLHVYDPEGRHVGINYDTGEVEIEIPEATYSGPRTEPQIIHITDPASGTYRIEMIGISAGDWTLTVQGFIGEDVVSTTSYTGSIEPGQEYESTATVSGIAGAITIDTTEPESVNEPPVADASGPYIGDEGSSISFDASGSYDPDGNITLYEWDFDGDGIYDTNSTSLNTTHTWDDDYNGTVTLRVTDDEGLTDTDSTEVTVNNIPPTVDAGPDKEALVYDEVFFNGSATDPGINDTFTFEWDFGDGTNLTHVDLGPGSASDMVTHPYNKTGNYTATLTVTDKDEGVDIDTINVVIHGARWLKQDAISKLGGIEPGKNAAHHLINNSIRSINKSLSDRLWIDDSHLSMMAGALVFDMEKAAVLNLETAKRIDSTTEDEVGEVIDKLTKADKILAVTAIDDAKSIEVDNAWAKRIVDWQIAKAEEELDKAYEYLDNDMPDKAITHFKLAWIHAQVAIKVAQTAGAASPA